MQTTPDIHTLTNILIMRCEGSLGDAILSTCCFREIKRINPRIKITVACFGLAYEFLKQNPYIDELFQLPIKTHIRCHQRWPSLIWAGLQLRKKHFDLVIDSSCKLAWNWRFCKWLAGSGRVLDAFHVPSLWPHPDQHASQHETNILKILGITNPSSDYDLPGHPQAQLYIRNILSQLKIEKYILLNPAGSIAARCFQPKTLERLHSLLASCHLPIVLPSVPSQTQYWENACKNLKIHVVQTPTVFDLIELVQNSVLVITPDTSVLHIASGFQKPTLAFYNNFTSYYAPNNKQAFVIRTNPTDINKMDWSQVETALQHIKQKLPM